MNFLKSLETSASGLYAQRKRMDIIASNLANIETTRTEKGGPYRRKMVVMSTKEMDQDFDKMYEKLLEESLKYAPLQDLIKRMGDPNSSEGTAEFGLLVFKGAGAC